MSDFTVNASELNRMSDQARWLSQEFGGTELSPSALDGIAGDQQALDAYHAFVGNWSDGLYYTQQHLQDLADRLTAAADGYASTDAKIAAAATGSGSADSG